MAKYRIEVARRKQDDCKTLPFVATAWLGPRLVAVQFGSHPGLAFQAAWDLVQHDREREGIVGFYAEGGEGE